MGCIGLHNERVGMALLASDAVAESCCVGVGSVSLPTLIDSVPGSIGVVPTHPAWFRLPRRGADPIGVVPTPSARWPAPAGVVSTLSAWCNRRGATRRGATRRGADSIGVVSAPTGVVSTPSAWCRLHRAWCR